MNKRDGVTSQTIELHIPDELAQDRIELALDRMVYVVKRSLDDPVDGGDVQASCRHICAEQHALVCLRMHTGPLPLGCALC